jgi:hypothetical protein
LDLNDQEEFAFTSADMFDKLTETSDIVLKESDKKKYNTDQKSTFCNKVFPGAEGFLGVITNAKTWLKKTWYFDNTAAKPKGTEIKVCYWKGSYTGSDSTALFDRFDGIFSKVDEDISDAKRQNGGSVFAPFFNKPVSEKQLNGQGFATPQIATVDSHALSIMHSNCLGEVGFSLFNPRVGGAMSFPSANLGFAKIVDYLQKSQECRADLYG